MKIKQGKKELENESMQVFFWCPLEKKAACRGKTKEQLVQIPVKG